MSGVHVHNTRKMFVLWIALPAAVFVLGCGQRLQRETAPVSGKAMLDGAPLTGGYITVTPESGRLAKGSIQPDGTFTLTTYKEGDGAQLGTHGVVVTEPPDDELTPRALDFMRIPEKYSRAGTSGLTITVEDRNDNVVTLELTSK